ncbi:MAG: hypothetical protein HC938_00395 [Nitrospira sp.]|nr:hypothetical protein [Nitrospira sp.]
MIVKLMVFAALFMVTVNGQDSSLAGTPQPLGESQQTVARSDNSQPSLLAMLVGFLRPADIHRDRQDNELGSSIHLVDGDEAAPTTPLVPMTSITVDTPDNQSSEADKERVRQEQLQQQLSAKETN